MPRLFNKEKYVTHYENSKFYFKLGSTLFRMGIFGVAHGWLSHISYNNGTWHSYTFNTYMNHVTYLLSSADIIIFLPDISRVCYIMKIKIWTAYWYIFFNSLNLLWLFKEIFNKHGHNFHDFSENDYPRPS